MEIILKTDFEIKRTHKSAVFFIHKLVSAYIMHCQYLLNNELSVLIKRKYRKDLWEFFLFQ